MKRSKIKERPIGSIFNWYGKQLKVVGDPIHNCSKCIFATGKRDCLPQKTHCLWQWRHDFIDVHYEEVKD